MDVLSQAALASSCIDAELLAEDRPALAEESRGVSPSSWRMVLGMLASVVDREICEIALTPSWRLSAEALLVKELLCRLRPSLPGTHAAGAPGRGDCASFAPESGIMVHSGWCAQLLEVVSMSVTHGVTKRQTPPGGETDLKIASPPGPRLLLALIFRGLSPRVIPDRLQHMMLQQRRL